MKPTPDFPPYPPGATDHVSLRDPDAGLSSGSRCSRKSET